MTAGEHLPATGLFTGGFRVSVSDSAYYPSFRQVIVLEAQSFLTFMPDRKGFPLTAFSLMVMLPSGLCMMYRRLKAVR